ncbi:unnamed protein product, partial [Mesorhabditis belari]|uniref:Uncharacterized protein n=1 Tax=Mesorhabditis belari TaxID=2138241 RepID=A0AAF3J5U0_9BILA
MEKETREECLIGPDDLMDSRHFNVFFATFRAFAQPVDVLDRMLRRYESLECDSAGSTSALVIQNSIRSVLICWMDMYPEDFYSIETDFAMLTNLLDFGLKHKMPDVRAKARILREKFKKIASQGGMIAALPSLDQLAYAFGYEHADYVNNARERAKMFDVGRGNCVQIAEQLTFWDAALFKELLTHQCQGCMWSKREKVKPDKVYTVKATIDQFNAVSRRVMTSIVLPDCRPDFRAKIIAKWIDIARELRALKNFSSLKAVISSLQSEPVHRLKSTWALVPSRSLTQFRELASIFATDVDGDEQNARRILDEEGTAKSSPLRRPQLIQNCRRTKSDVNLAECQGTVPYLGSFLTDLTMIDQAASDYTEEGLINFDKRRREFEVLAKLRLFQSAARAYKIPMDREFCAWFFYLPCLSEDDCFQRSMEIERPPAISTPDLNSRNHNLSSVNSSSSNMNKSNTLSRLFNNSRTSEDNHSISGSGTPLMGQNSRDSGIHNDDWTDGGSGTPAMSRMADSGHPTSSSTAPSTPASTISGKAGRSIFYHTPPHIGSEFSPMAMFQPHQRTHSSDSHDRARLPPDYPRLWSPKMKHRSASFDRGVIHRVSHGNQLNGQIGARRGTLPPGLPLPHHNDASQRREPTSASTVSSGSSQSNNSTPTFHLARVGLDDALQPEGSGGANYKCIKVENGDRMPELIERILEKHLIDGDKSEFCLVQLLENGGEFQLPDKCNPFYAMAPDKSHMFNLILRRRKELDGGSQSPALGPSAKKLNKMKRSNLLRWSSGYL